MEKCDKEELSKQPEQLAQTYLESRSFFHNIPPEILNMIMLNLAPNKSPDLAYSAYVLLEVTKNFRLIDKYFNQTVEGLIEQTCSIKHHDIKLLQQAFRKNNISYQNGQLLYDFSTLEHAECQNLAELIYMLYLKKDSNSSEPNNSFVNLVMHALASNQKEALKYLGSTSTYRQLSSTTALDSLSLSIIHQELSSPDLNLKIEKLFRETVPLLHTGFCQLGPLHWAIIFDHTDIIKILLDELVVMNFRAIVAMLNFASRFANPATFEFILNYCKVRYEPYYVADYNKSIFKHSKIWKAETNPLQTTFDSGNEANFMTLVNNGVDITNLHLRQTKANAKFELFQQIISRNTHKTTQNVNEKRRNAQIIVLTLGTAVMGLVMYQLFSKIDYVQFEKLCSEKALR